MKIKYHSSNFDLTDFPHLPNGDQEFQFTRWELLAASFTVGRANRWAVFAHGPYSLYEMMYRSGMIAANLRKKTRGNVEQTSAYKALDPSEKSAVSYFIGLTMSKLMADKLMDIPFLMHLEVYQEEIIRKYGRIIYNPGKSRPDLIGFDSNLNPYVFEAKGRSGTFDGEAFRKAKEQAEMLISIGNPPVTPNVAVAVQAYFNAQKELQIKWKDPKSNSKGLEYDFVSGPDIVKKYYMPFFNLLNHFDKINIYKGYSAIYLSSMDMTVHVPNAIENFFEKNNITNNETIEIIQSIPTAEIPIVKFPITENKTKKGGNRKKDELNDKNRVVRMKDKIIFEFGTSWENRFIEES
jgi:hypothetical protein